MDKILTVDNSKLKIQHIQFMSVMLVKDLKLVGTV